MLSFDDVFAENVVRKIFLLKISKDTLLIYAKTLCIKWPHKWSPCKEKIPFAQSTKMYYMCSWLSKTTFVLLLVRIKCFLLSNSNVKKYSSKFECFYHIMLYCLSSPPCVWAKQQHLRTHIATHKTDHNWETNNVTY